jgi:hypothetical protein
MYLTVDISTRDLLSQMLENNSMHSVLYFLAELEKVPEPEEWANACIKLLNRTGEEY